MAYLHQPETFSRHLAGEWQGVPPAYATGFSIDTRTLREGEIFVALRTSQRDGHEFLAAARSAGAAGALVAMANPQVDLPQFVTADPAKAMAELALAHRRSFAAPVVAVTGSCGKTSTKDLLARLLGGADVHRTEANLNNQLGVPLTLLTLDPNHHRFAVVEAGINQVGEMDFLTRTIEPDVAVVTHVGPAHLAGLGSLAGVAREKACLLNGLRPSSFAVFPASCLAHAPFREVTVPVLVVAEEGRQVQFMPTQAELVTYSRESGETGNSDTLRLRVPGYSEVELALPPISAGMCSNLALAVTVALRLGVEPEVLPTRLQGWQPARMRGEIRRHDGRDFYVDCYNANPASMIDTLAAFDRRYPYGGRLLVLGSMWELGEEAETWHRRVGERIPLRDGDALVLIGPHALAYADGVIGAGGNPELCLCLKDTQDARETVEQFRGPTLLKGSRVHGLEVLLPEDAVAVADGGVGKGGAPC